MTPHLCNLWSLSLGGTNNVFKVLVPLKCTCIPLAWQTFLNFSPMPLMYGNTMVMSLLLVGWFLDSTIVASTVVVACVG